MNNKKRWKKKLILLLCAVAVLAVYTVSAFVLLRSAGVQENPVDLAKLPGDTSLILVTGEGYALEKEQEEQYLNQQPPAEEEQALPPEENAVESIVEQPKENPEPEAGANPVQEEPGEGSQPGAPKEEQTTEPESEAKDTPEEPTPGGEGGTEGGETEPETPDEKPVIETNITNQPYGSSLSFTVWGTDAEGHVIDVFYYAVTFDGILLYSAGTDAAGFATYRVEGAAEGAHTVAISVTDRNGRENQARYTLEVAEAADVPVEEWVTLEVEARSIGISGILQTAAQIYKDESAAHFVKRVLTENGFAPAMDDGGYLSRIGGVNAGEPSVPEAISGYVEENYGALTDINVPGALGERDYTAGSGWVYLYNGIYQGVGLYGITLTDGDVIHLGFTLGGGAEYNGTWLSYGSW